MPKNWQISYKLAILMCGQCWFGNIVESKMAALRNANNNKQPILSSNIKINTPWAGPSSSPKPTNQTPNAFVVLHTEIVTTVGPSFSNPITLWHMARDFRTDNKYHTTTYKAYEQTFIKSIKFTRQSNNI